MRTTFKAIDEWHRSFVNGMELLTSEALSAPPEETEPLKKRFYKPVDVPNVQCQ